MASSEGYLQFILGQLSGLDEITYRAMMGEFIIYYCGKIVGGIYDDRLLVKPTKSAIAYMSDPAYEVPYEGAKEMLLVEEVDNKAFLTGLFHAMISALERLILSLHHSITFSIFKDKFFLILITPSSVVWSLSKFSSNSFSIF